MQTDRRCVLVAIRVTRSEHARWLKAAALEDLKLVELIRESVRLRLGDLERLRLLRHGPDLAAGPPRPAA
jgi:hypothetical protein